MSSFNAILGKILSGLPDNYYLGGHKEDGAFDREILQPYESQTEIDPEAIEAEVLANWRVTPRTHEGPISIACAYAVAAKRASDRDRAWTYLCQAQYWYGVSSATIVLPDAVERAHMTKASNGASKRNEKYEPLRLLARELAASGKYQSKRNAALSIRELILSKAKDLKVNLSEDQAERTITKWLDGMTFARKQPTTCG
ncbi:hypothetical protein [Burkholderia gladioli]|uniref:hypothetical protein n=1 Tax=Burkholderia gladioli TaxID=28095 RepID=UPI001641F87C|nr:hypothetical protein [Burkholderia gladioli]